IVSQYSNGKLAKSGTGLQNAKWRQNGHLMPSRGYSAGKRSRNHVMICQLGSLLKNGARVDWCESRLTSRLLTAICPLQIRTVSVGWQGHFAVAVSPVRTR